MMIINYLLVHFPDKLQDKLFTKYFLYLEKLSLLDCKKLNFGLLLTIKTNRVHFWQLNISMGKHSFMEVAFPSRSVSNKKNTILSWLKSIKRKILILLPIQSITCITKFTTKDSIITTTIKPNNLNLKHHRLEPKYSTLTVQIAITFSRKSIH